MQVARYINIHKVDATHPDFFICKQGRKQTNKPELNDKHIPFLADIFHKNTKNVHNSILIKCLYIIEK